MTLPTRLPRGLYGITPEWDDTSRLLQAIRDAHRGGLAVLQWRRKRIDPSLAETQRDAVQTLCQSLSLPFIINDDWPLALRSGADGVHLGREDGVLREARQQLGALRLLGASCYDSLALAERALSQDVDYVAFGAMYPSHSKPNAPRAQLATLTQAKALCAEHATPKGRAAVVAIGGITLDNAAPLIAAGADSLAVINGLFEADDVYACARAFTQLFTDLSQ